VIGEMESSGVRSVDTQQQIHQIQNLQPRRNIHLLLRRTQPTSKPPTTQTTIHHNHKTSKNKTQMEKRRLPRMEQKQPSHKPKTHRQHIRNRPKRPTTNPNPPNTIRKNLQTTTHQLLTVIGECVNQCY